MPRFTDRCTFIGLAVGEGSSGRRRTTFEISPSADMSFDIELFFFICFGKLFTCGVSGSDTNDTNSRGAFQDIGGTQRSWLSTVSAEDRLEEDDRMLEDRCGA